MAHELLGFCFLFEFKRDECPLMKFLFAVNLGCLLDVFVVVPAPEPGDIFDI
jgi:hypothetical protein